MNTTDGQLLNLATVSELELIRLGIQFQEQYKIILQNIQAVNNEMMKRVNVIPEQKKNQNGTLAVDKKKLN